MSTTRALFGGALLAAGVSTSQASHMFNLLDEGSGLATGYFSYAYVGAGDYTADPYDFNITAYDYAYAPDSLNLSVTSVDGAPTPSTTQNTELLRVESTWDGTSGDGSFFAGYLGQFFTVPYEVDLELSWDLSNTDFFGPYLAAIRTADTGILAEVSPGAGDPAAGTETVTLQPGVEYFLVLDIGAPFGYDTSTKFVQGRLVPAPAAIAPFGLAGIAATRRRRH